MRKSWVRLAICQKTNFKQLLSGFWFCPLFLCLFTSSLKLNCRCFSKKWVVKNLWLTELFSNSFFFIICMQIIIQNLKPPFLIWHKVCDLSSGQNWRHKSQQWWNQDYMKIQKRERDESLWWKKEIQICFLRYARAAKYLNMPDMFSTQNKKTEFSYYNTSRKLNSDTMCWWNRRSHPKHLICISQFITATQPDSGTRIHVPNGFVRWGTRH